MNPPEECPTQQENEVVVVQKKRRGRPPRNLPVLFQEEPEPGVTVEAIEVPTPKVKRERGRPRKLETLTQLQAFEYYVDLGDTRTQHQVGVKFGIKDFEVARWSKNFQWLSRIQEYQNKSIQERVIEKAFRFADHQMELVLMMQSAMTGPDPLNPNKTALTERATVYGMKEQTTTVLNTLKTLSEAVGIKKAEKEIEEMGNGGGGKGKGGGVMVNVVINK